MIESKKISRFTTAGIFIAIISLVLCTMILNTSYSSSGISEEVKKIASYEIKNPSNVFISNEHINIVNKPTIKDNEINYGIHLNQLEDYSQFTFELENTGNIPMKVKRIRITYPPELQSFVSVTLEGLAADDTIQPGATFSNIKVITKYFNGYYNENQVLNPVLIENINIKIDFYE